MKTLAKDQPCPHCGRYNNRGISIDALIIQGGKILLIRRGVEPDKGKWATPGGYIGWNESAEEALMREVQEETGLTVKKIRFLNVYSSPHRHPKQVITLAYIVEVDGEPKKGDDADAVAWFPLNALPTPLAFDHKQNINEAITIAPHNQT